MRSSTRSVRLREADKSKIAQLSRFSETRIVRIRNLSFAVKKSLTEAKMSKIVR